MKNRYFNLAGFGLTEIALALLLVNTARAGELAPLKATSATMPRQAIAEKLAAQLQKIGKVPGGAIAIFADERITKLGFGQRGLQDARKVDPATVFRIASLSKTFTGELAAMLVSEGTIAWNTPVRSVVPELTFTKGSAQSALQFQHLLSHSTGVLPYAYDQQLETQPSLEKLLPQFAKAPIVCRPGACYGYQNTLFSVAGLMMARKSGRSFEQLLQKRIFTPLNMQSTSVGFAALQASKNLAWPHVQAENRWTQVLPTASYYGALPAAGINSNIDDLALWLAAQLGARPEVIPDLAVQNATTARIRSNKFQGSKHWARLLSDEHYGYGWRVLQAQDETIIFHSGGVRGYGAHISFSKKHRVGMVVLVNAERGLDSIAVDFWCQVFAAKKVAENLKPGAKNICLAAPKSAAR